MGHSASRRSFAMPVRVLNICRVQDLFLRVTDSCSGCWLSVYVRVVILSCRVMVMPGNRGSSACVYLATIAVTDSVHLLFTIHKWAMGMTGYRSVHWTVGQTNHVSWKRLLLSFSGLCFVLSQPKLPSSSLLSSLILSPSSLFLCFPDCPCLSPYSYLTGSCSPCLSDNLALYLSVSPPVCLSVCLSAVCLSVCLSVSPLSHFLSLKCSLSCPSAPLVSLCFCPSLPLCVCLPLSLSLSLFSLCRSDWMCKILFWYGLTGKCCSVIFIIIVTLQRYK